MRHYKIGPTIMTVLIVLMLVAGWSRTPQPDAPARALTESQKRMVQKFGPDRGYELKVDAMKGEEFRGVTFHEIGIDQPFYRKGTQNLRNETQMGMSGPIPEQVRITWRKTGQVGSPPNHDDLVDEIVGEEIIEVGSRIPQALIDDLKRDPKGGLRLKFRMRKQSTLIGWDIERRPGYDVKKRDIYGEAVYVEAVHSMVGGDFREAKIYNGEAVRKGWYIDKKTGQKIETDY